VPQQNVGVRAPDGAASPSAERLAAPASPAAAEVVTARFGWPPPPKKEAMDACLPLAGLGSDILATREPSNACAAGAGRHSERLETPASTVLHNRMRSPPTGIHGCWTRALGGRPAAASHTCLDGGRQLKDALYRRGAALVGLLLVVHSYGGTFLLFGQGSG